MTPKARHRARAHIVEQRLHPELTGKILAAFYSVYHALGGGFMEPAYVPALAKELSQLGLKAECQVPITVRRKHRPVGLFRADLLVNDVVLVELQARAAIEPARETQLMDCLRATTVEVGLLLNFGPEPRFKRFVFPNERKQASLSLRH
jgi:GxxExxY protein